MMIKLLLLILLALLLMAFGYSKLISDKSSVRLPGSQNTQYSSPTDALQGAKDAVGQSQDVQDKVNDYTRDQLNQ